MKLKIILLFLTHNKIQVEMPKQLMVANLKII